MKVSIRDEKKFPDALDVNNIDNVWTMYTHIQEFENHFNKLQSDYRSLASKWLLAIFAAVGFVLTETINWILPDAIVITLIGLAGAVGIWRLWLIDLGVYHRLLSAAFTCGVSLEERHKWLPPIRIFMTQTQRGGRARNRLVWYYVVGITMPLLISLSSLTAFFYEIEQLSPGEQIIPFLGPLVSSFVLVVVGILVIVVVAITIFYVSTNITEFRDYR